MTDQPSISRINWRQILLHFFAFFFLMHAFHILSFLINTKLVDITLYSDEHGTYNNLTEQGIPAADLMIFIFWTNLAYLIGLVTGFIISVLISIKRDWSWMNAVITFIITYLLYRFNLLKWVNLNELFWYFRNLFHEPALWILIYGTLLLTIALLIFLLPRANRFIAGNTEQKTS